MAVSWCWETEAEEAGGIGEAFSVLEEVDWDEAGSGCSWLGIMRGMVDITEEEETAGMFEEEGNMSE